MGRVLDRPLRVACVGASVTFGLGLANRRDECYPAVLQRLCDGRFGAGAVLVRNFGYSGATAARGSNEPYWETPSFTAAVRFEPHLALMTLGTNDAQFANASARTALARDLADLVELFRDLGAAVLVADPPPAFPPVAEIDFEALEGFVRPTIRRVAEGLDTPLVDFCTPLADSAAEFPDGLHPTAAVARRMAEISMEALAPRMGEWLRDDPPR